MIRAMGRSHMADRSYVNDFQSICIVEMLD